jgi:HSP20 family molecular chaperone IbpA
MFSKIAYVFIFVAVTAAKGKWLTEIISPKKSENEASIMNPPFSIETFLNNVPRVWDALDHALYRQLMSPVMSIDSKETKKDYQLAVDLPGVQKESITLLLKGTVLIYISSCTKMMKRKLQETN